MSITGNSDNIFVNNANLKIAKAGKGLIFADGTVLYSADPVNGSNVLSNIYEFANAQTAFVISNVTANTGFAGNTAPTDAISVSSNLFISYTGNLTTSGQITAGSVANVESNILSLESDLSDNSSRIDTLVTKTTDITWSDDVTTVANDLTVGGDLTVTGNVITSNNIQTNDPVFMIASNATNDTTNSAYMMGRAGANVMISHYPDSGTYGNVVIGYTLDGSNAAAVNLDTGNSLSLYVHGYIGDETISNLSANIVTIESDLSDNSSRIGLYESIIHLSGDNVGISPSSFTPSANLHVVGNVIATSNLGIGSHQSDAPLSVTGSGTNFYNFNSTRGIYMGVHNNDFSVIECVSSGSNSGWIDFKNANSDTDFSERIRGGNGSLEFYSNNSANPALVLDQNSNVGIGTTSPSANLHVNSGSVDGYILEVTRSTSNMHSNILISTSDGSINGEHDDAAIYLATPYLGKKTAKCAIIAEGMGSYSKSNLHFCLNDNNNNDLVNTANLATSRMTILSGGNVGISNTTPNHKLSVNGDVYTSGSYLPFTGAHISLNALPSHEDGTLVASTGNVSTDGTIYNTFTEIEPTTVSKDKRVIGVTCKRETEISDGDSNTEPNTYTITTTQIIAVGEGRMLVCNENGDIENGDYICSSNVLGHGMKQDDDLLHNYTVAKATEDCSFTGSDDRELVSVTFHCG